MEVVEEAFVKSLLHFQRIVSHKMLLFGGRDSKTRDCDRLEDTMAMGAVKEVDDRCHEGS